MPNPEVVSGGASEAPYPLPYVIEELFNFLVLYENTFRKFCNLYSTISLYNLKIYCKVPLGYLYIRVENPPSKPRLCTEYNYVVDFSFKVTIYVVGNTHVWGKIRVCNF